MHRSIHKVVAPKPIQCEAVSSQKVIIVTCPPLQEERYRFSKAGMQEFVRRVVQNHQGNDSAKVLVRGMSSMAIISLGAYEDWQTNYFVDRSMHRYSLDPPREFRLQGIDAIVDLGSSLSLRARVSIDSANRNWR